MIEPDVLVYAVVAAYRACPELIFEMDGDSARIQGYRDQHPERANIRQAVLQVGAPGLLVFYDGDSIAKNGTGYVRRYRVQIVWRGRALPSAEAGGPSHVRYLLEKAIPSTSEVPLRNYTFHASFQPLEIQAVQRVSIAVDDAGTTIDYWQATASAQEIGDE